MYQLLYADQKGRMYEHPNLLAGGRTGSIFVEILEEDLIPMPPGATLVMVPGGSPVGIKSDGGFNIASGRRREQVFAVGALLPQGYTRTLLPAYVRKDIKPLPLLGYAAVGWKEGMVYVAAIQTDELAKWNPIHYSTPELAGFVDAALEHLGDNRIIKQLSNCALKYNCFTAQNIFYRRWEGGIPVSPSCNANCLGCISLQPADCCPSPQNRIQFKPTVEEIVEVALPHLREAEDGIISFGQGCEGEPSLAADTLVKAIKDIRISTDSGTLNMNTNAGYFQGIKSICEAGIDSLRVSAISAIEDTYISYYMPRSYHWKDVCDSIAFARDRGVYVSLNLLTFPGLTDSKEEFEALINFIIDLKINMVQIRNLNIDPDYLGSKIPLNNEVLGLGNALKMLKEKIPGLVIGNYSKPVRGK